MKDRIKQLLDSKDLDNILIGIQLAYKLPLEEFEELFKWRKTGYNQRVGFRFRRNNKEYLMGKGAILYAMGTNLYKQQDITPEDYEGEN